jgi:hypothetical protein
LVLGAKLKRQTISSSSSDNSDGGIDDPVEGYRLVNVANLLQLFQLKHMFVREVR